MEELKLALAARGIQEEFRITPQRIQIYNYLSKVNHHPTADEIIRALKKIFPTISGGTIYNNLKVFKNVGLIKEIVIKNVTRFELNTHFHYHIICKDCGEIQDLNYPVFEEVRDFAKQHTGFNICSHTIEFQGQCQACQTEAELKETS